MITRTRFLLVLVPGLALVVAACGGDRSIAPDHLRLEQWVTGQAARNIGRDGRFILSSSSPDQLSEAQAVSLAKAYAKIAGRWIGSTWEHDRGATIRFDELEACPRAYFAQDVLEPSPLGSRSLRELVGPKWLVAMCSPDGKQIVSIAVSALATDLTVAKGHIIGPGGAQFTSAGIPVSLSAAPISPEEAAMMAAEASGARVVTVPELVLPPPPFPPQLAKWRIQLDHPVVAHGLTTGQRQTTSELYVGFGETWKTTGIYLGGVLFAAPQFRDAEAAGIVVPLTVISGYSTQFEPATVERP